MVKLTFLLSDKSEYQGIEMNLDFFFFLSRTEANLMPCHHILPQGMQLSHELQLGYPPAPEDVKGAPKDGLIVKDMVKDIWVIPDKLAGVPSLLVSPSPTSVERG